MRTTGVIAEYNPFHMGHRYHLEQARQQTNADFVCVVMSGDFVQRGAPAIIDKYTRTRMALENGADLVFELPCIYATASAELFSEAAITFFERIGVIDALCFGSEQASLTLLSRIAHILQDEPQSYKMLLAENLREGFSYPRAVYAAVTRYLLESDTLTNSTIEQAYHLSNQLSCPNNILGIEYLKALYRTGSSIRPFCIERKGSGYHDAFLSDDELGSATAIREILESDSSLKLLRRHVPSSVFHLLTSLYHVTYPISGNDLSPLLDYCILTNQATEQIADLTKELAQRIKNQSLEPKTFSQWGESLKTKNMTRTHINRALLHTVLRITKEDMNTWRESGLIPYARLLGFRAEAAPLLTRLKECSSIPIITKVADAKHLLSGQALRMFEKDLEAAELYRRLVYHRYQTTLADEYRAGIILSHE